MIKLSGGLLETRLRQARGRANQVRDCRHGCPQVEAISHIQQICTFTHDYRVRRHDNMVNKVASILQRRGWSITKEPRIPTREGLRKPDLICERNGVVYVLDGQVCVDVGVASPEDAHRNKIRYYNEEDIISYVQRGFGCPPIFSSITVNWRGFWSVGSINTLKAMGMSRAELKLVTVRVLEDSVGQWRVHRAGGRHREVPGP